MTLFDHLPSRAALVLLFCCFLTGCQTHQSITPVGNGYEQVTHPTSGFLEAQEPPRISFEWREPSGKTIPIWPSLSGVYVVVKGDLAIFVGDKAYVEPAGKVTHPRLFAVQSPGLPLDITDEMLWRWAKVNGKDFATALDRFSRVTPKEMNGRLELHLEFWSEELLFEDKNWPDRSDLKLDWTQVADMLRAVQTKGVVERDLRWHTAYIGEQF